MREKRGSGTFARRMEEALAPLLVFLFVILPLYLSITNPLLSISLLATTFLTKIALPLVILSQLILISVISLRVLPPFLMYLLLRVFFLNLFPL